jgi:hypothetical protein
VSDSDNKLTRRELLRSAGRYAALAGIGVLAAKLMWRSGSVGADGDIASQTCVNSGICSGCGAFDACRLPQALSARVAKAK